MSKVLDVSNQMARLAFLRVYPESSIFETFDHQFRRRDPLKSVGMLSRYFHKTVTAAAEVSFWARFEMAPGADMITQVRRHILYHKAEPLPAALWMFYGHRWFVWRHYGMVYLDKHIGDSLPLNLLIGPPNVEAWVSPTWTR
jgi:hypothetical protein